MLCDVEAGPDMVKENIMKKISDMIRVSKIMIVIILLIFNFYF